MSSPGAPSSVSSTLLAGSFATATASSSAAVAAKVLHKQRSAGSPPGSPNAKNRLSALIQSKSLEKRRSGRCLATQYLLNAGGSCGSGGSAAAPGGGGSTSPGHLGGEIGKALDAAANAAANVLAVGSSSTSTGSAGGSSSSSSSLAAATAVTETRATKPKAHPGFYKVGIELAQGSEGDVFAAVQIPADRQVALKRIAINGPKTKKHAWTELCVAEAVFLGMTAQDHEVELKRLKRWESAPPHPYIVQTMDFFAGFDGIDRELFLVSERCLFGLDDLIRGVRESRVQYERTATTSIPGGGDPRGPANKVDKTGVAVAGRRDKPSSTSSSASAPPPSSKPASSASSNRTIQSRFSEIEIRKVFLQMLEALAFLNKLGFLHRDVKAENILWAPAGNYKLCDFGVSVRVPMTAGGSSTSSEVLAAAAAGGPGGMLGPSTGRAGASRDYAGSPAGGIAATDPMKRVQQSSTGLYSPSSPLLEQMGRQSVCSPFSPGDDVLNMRDLIDRVPDTPFDEGAPASNGTSPTSPDAAEDGQHRVSVTDLNPRLTVGLKNRANCGTLWTMSPELLRPKIHDASTDIWSLAIVLYEMCYLDKPYNSMELLAYQNDNSLDALPVVLQLANGMSGLSLGVPAMLAGGSATVQLPTGITSPAVVEAANSAAVGASSSKGANAKRVRPGTTGGSTTSTGANSNASSSPVVGRLSTGSSAASPTLHRKGSATGLGLGATTATPGGGTSGAANSNSSTQKAKPTWLKWFYSKDLKKLLVAMLNSNRKERPTPLELKGATPATCTTATGEHLDWYASLVKPIVEKPPTYATLTSSSSSAASKSATSGTSSSGANPRERRPSTPSSPAIKGAQQHLQGGGGNRDTPATGAGASTPPVKKGSSVEEIEQVLLTAEKFCFNLLENANSARRSCHPLPPTNDLSPIALAKHKTAVVAREEKKLKSAAASAGSSVEEPGAPRVEEARSGRGAPGTRKNNESSLSLSPPKRNSRQKEKQTNGHEPQQVVDNVGQSEPLSDGEEQPSSYVQHAVVAHQTTAQTIQEQPPLRNITQNSIADHIEARLRAQNATAELLQQVASLEQACVKAANANHKVGAASTISKSRASNAIRIPGAGLLPPMPIEEDIIARDGAETSTTAEQIPNIKKECQETELPRTSPVPGIGIASESRIPGTRATACNDVDEAELLDHAERYDSNSYGGEHQQAAPFVEDDLELCSPGLLDDPDAAWRASMPPLLDRGKSNLSSWDNNIQTDFNAGRTFPDEAGRGGEIMTTPSYSLSGLSSQRAAGGGGGSATGATGSRLTSAAGSSVPLVASGATPTGTATVAGVASRIGNRNGHYSTSTTTHLQMLAGGAAGSTGASSSVTGLHVLATAGGKSLLDANSEASSTSAGTRSGTSTLAGSGTGTTARNKQFCFYSGDGVAGSSMFSSNALNVKQQCGGRGAGGSRGFVFGAPSLPSTTTNFSTGTSHQSQHQLPLLSSSGGLSAPAEGTPASASSSSYPGGMKVAYPSGFRPMTTGGSYLVSPGTSNRHPGYFSRKTNDRGGGSGGPTPPSTLSDKNLVLHPRRGGSGGLG
mmetsp:Transcript_8479/g.20417  ORF Transcript_8479/g.20417 Transcript_8479/m.20417 type:complete len:1571 (+) Transcript_8479:78-4790(+)